MAKRKAVDKTYRTNKDTISLNAEQFSAHLGLFPYAENEESTISLNAEQFSAHLGLFPYAENEERGAIMKNKIKIPEKIPLRGGKMLPNGNYVSTIELIGKSHPKYKIALEEYLLLESSPVLKEMDETHTNRKV
ncbi:hypothetical protein A2Z67_04470 [Candidatus Woesebacteria bacterium RBG_13_36_22]|uniref:Uncharacterized protein n=1 Tax=Candidatus Woesebacteria bacterium RBG_13_36_22 TaxID=1802478 RepID=A0A1F7X2F5_9BACT|nr:MAG: hypothetical protein A2Z67_04470 [Candidatus Woesebacteria bacterium RBG_13_36_22]